MPPTTYELAEVSLAPLPGRCGPLEAPMPVAIDASIPDSVLNDTVVCPYNQPEIAEALIARHRSPRHRADLRRGHHAACVLGGAQETFGITPDLTAMGKIIGGGLPIGAIGRQA